MSHAVVDDTNCTNCGADLHGGYCAHCGQKAMPLNPSIGVFLHDLAHELLHVDGKIFRSLRLLLTKPGFLTLEMFRGRRASYVGPIRLYLVFSVAAFAVLALMPREEALSERDVEEIREGGARGGFTITDRGPNFEVTNLTAEQRRQLGEDIVHLFPRAMFVLVPGCALLIQWHARKARRNYPQHLYFALHVHAAYFALLALTTPLGLIGRGVGVVAPAARVVFILVYTAIAFRRAYGYSRFGASLRTLSVFVTYMMLVGIAFVVTAGVAYYVGIGVHK